MSPAPCRAVILDRDGTINVDRPHYVLSLAELELLPGVPAAIARLTQAGYRVLVASVQQCVGKGLLAPAGLERIHAAIADAVARAGGRIDGWYVCPHLDADGCACRKPKPGLVLQAQTAWGFDPAATWAIGDAERDLGMARAAGCRPALVRTGKGSATAAAHPEVPAFATLDDAVTMVLAQDADAPAPPRPRRDFG